MLPFTLILLSMFYACQEEVAIENITDPPVVTEADKAYAHAFKPLDGNWQGEFVVYRDQRGQTEGESQPQSISTETLEHLPLQVEQTLQVRQEYVSETPYFQLVRIRDTYVTAPGDTQTVTSRGVNKVQNGKLWCVVKKPEETIVHSGTLTDSTTLIWQREERDPLKIEFFRETVEQNEYVIVGWGYYGDDDPQLAPQHWFRGRYERVE